MEKGLIVRKESFWTKLKKFLGINKEDAIEEAKKEENNQEEYLEALYELVEKMDMKLDEFFKIGTKYKEQAIEEISKMQVISPNLKAKDIQNMNNMDFMNNFAFANGKKFEMMKEEKDGETVKKFINHDDNKECIIKEDDDKKTVEICLNNGTENHDYERPDLAAKVRKEIGKDGKTITEMEGAIINSDEKKIGNYKEVYEGQNGETKTVKTFEQIYDEKGTLYNISTQRDKINGGEGVRETKYVDGKPIYQMERDNNKGSIIKEFDKNGNVKAFYLYDKDGNFINGETMKEDGQKVQLDSPYKGIDFLPTVKMEDERILNGGQLSGTVNYYDELRKAGLPETLQNVIYVLDYVDIEKESKEFVQVNKMQENQKKREENNRINKNIDYKQKKKDDIDYELE